MARGSVYPRQLASGATVYDVRYRSSNGKQRHKRGFTRKREADQYLSLDPPIHPGSEVE
ncbi:hypothetical protein NBH00_12000 [Paraconexibacter antarcticus]|uniref:AP2-like integrase N-terminal domain-containing protein n=1 Tax=Paraconexibacter antarcticus TaxID=2949664 RepID=A0ABY5DZC2_9ACTN|nr:hypothetical protein [Paraconexibacter antarcticus]UTI66904.1 hypothetical protein NBH00_12000 [Paraconexibacter antarcticus]